MRRDWDDGLNVSGTDMMKVVEAIVKPKEKIHYLFIYLYEIVPQYQGSHRSLFSLICDYATPLESAE